MQEFIRDDGETILDARNAFLMNHLIGFNSP